MSGITYILGTMSKLRTGRPMKHGSILGRGKKLFFFPKCPDLRSFLINEYRGLDMELTSHLYPVPSLTRQLLYV